MKHDEAIIWRQKLGKIDGIAVTKSILTSKIHIIPFWSLHLPVDPTGPMFFYSGTWPRMIRVSLDVGITFAIFPILGKLISFPYWVQDLRLMAAKCRSGYRMPLTEHAFSRMELLGGFLKQWAFKDEHWSWDWFNVKLNWIFSITFWMERNVILNLEIRNLEKSVQRRNFRWLATVLRCDDNRNFVCLRPKFSLCQKKEKCLLLPLTRSMPMIQWSFQCLIQVMCRTDCWNGLIFYPRDDPKHDTNVFFGTSLSDSEFPQGLAWNHQDGV